MTSFKEIIKEHKLELSPNSLEILQVNLTKLCNQACSHCHVDSSPRRREMMDSYRVKKLLELMERPEFKTIDLTGGAPELHPEFKDIVVHAVKLGKKVLVRHNLTVSFDPHPIDGQSMLWVHDFLTENKAEVVSSLPYYREFLTDRQRGQGVFKKSIKGLQELNRRGYGQPNSGLILNLVFNPVGPYLPPAQEAIEHEYKVELKSKFNITFNNLFTITNMPIKRFKNELLRTNQYEEYMERLHASFNPIAAKSVMCRNMLSVSWDGYIYDCDFNQMLELPCSQQNTPVTIENFNYKEFLERKIIFGDHCFGCTAGAGSSCGGTTTK
jgi:radical SAM/Cys-rich protein